jgi:hypothetical protein
MINFFNFFENFLDTDRVSDDNLRKFVESHIQRLIANNGGGEFTAILTDTTNKYTSYFGSMSSEDIAFAVQQSLTATVDNMIEDFKDDVSGHKNLIAFHFPEDTPTYQEFFPLGLTEYRNATKANVELLMARMKSACTAHQAVLGPAIVVVFSGYATNYPLARNAQILKVGEVAAGKTGTATTRDDVETQVIANMHFIGFTFPGNVTECMKFFDQSIIRPSQSSASDGIGRAAGIITDSVSGTPIDNAVVDFTDVEVNSRQSHDGGIYRTTNVPIGMRHIKVVHPGHAIFEADVNIVDEGDTPLNISLNPE